MPVHSILPTSRNDNPAVILYIWRPLLFSCHNLNFGCVRGLSRYLTEGGVAVIVVLTDGHSFDRMRSEKAPLCSLPVPVKHGRHQIFSAPPTTHFSIHLTRIHTRHLKTEMRIFILFSRQQKAARKAGCHTFASPPRPNPFANTVERSAMTSHQHAVLR